MLKNSENLLLSTPVLTFICLHAIAPGNAVCNAGGCEGRDYARRANLPTYARLSALVCDHVAGAAATQVHAGPPAAVSVSRSHQSTCLPLSVLTQPCKPHPYIQLHNLMEEATLPDTWIYCWGKKMICFLMEKTTTHKRVYCPPYCQCWPNIC